METSAEKDFGDRAVDNISVEPTAPLDLEAPDQRNISLQENKSEI